MHSVLMVSKPVAPPWSDSSKNLVKDLALAGERFSYRVLTPEGFRLPGEGVFSEPIYRRRGRYTPAITDNLLVARRLLRQDDTALTHFFFAPNPRASLAARICLRWQRRVTVQTVCSVPSSFDTPGKLLFARRVVVLSQHTLQRFIEAGVDARRLVHIPPGIRIPAHPTAERRLRLRRELGLPAHRPVIIYPGDYQFSKAAETFARITPLLADLRPLFIFACRPKQEASLQEERRISDLLKQQGTFNQVRMLGEVDGILDLLAASDLCVLPAESLYAKMDLPLVLLEAMALGVPLVVSDCPPLSELLKDDVGALVPPRDPGALAAAVRSLFQDGQRLRALGRNARRAAQERYSIKEVSRQYEDLYQELIRAETTSR